MFLTAWNKFLLATLPSPMEPSIDYAVIYYVMVQAQKPDIVQLLDGQGCIFSSGMSVQSAISKQAVWVTLQCMY
jgi:hypothetical protein